MRKLFLLAIAVVGLLYMIVNIPVMYSIALAVVFCILVATVLFTHGPGMNNHSEQQELKEVQQRRLQLP
jgi:hypothetical protein